MIMVAALVGLGIPAAAQKRAAEGKLTNPVLFEQTQISNIRRKEQEQ
jgi:hypothetical protein